MSNKVSTQDWILPLQYQFTCDDLWLARDNTQWHIYHQLILAWMQFIHHLALSTPLILWHRFLKTHVIVCIQMSRLLMILFTPENYTPKHQPMVLVSYREQVLMEDPSWATHSRNPVNFLGLRLVCWCPMDETFWNKWLLTEATLCRV